MAIIGDIGAVYGFEDHLLLVWVVSCAL